MSETQPIEPVQPAEPVQPMGLEEFCRRASETERSVELIAAFEAVERQSGRQYDSEAAYRARFSAIASRLAD